ncbi:MAG: hypothetical protein P8184_16775 [Calditrichia bacterium]
MSFFKKFDDTENDDAFPYEDDDFEEDEETEEESQEAEDEEVSDDEENEDEDIDELEKIEKKLAKGEDVAISAIESSILPKSKIVYVCPRCRKIYINKKWVKDNITDMFTVRTELAYCPKCVGKTFENFVGSVEIYDKKLADRKEEFVAQAKQIERDLEDAMPFEKIIDVVEKKGILFIFANTTRLALDIGKRFRQEFGGGIQYEWFERNQYLRVKWYDQVDNRGYFKERIRALKERRFGMFSFEDED